MAVIYNFTYSQVEGPSFNLAQQHFPEPTTFMGIDPRPLAADDWCRPVERSNLISS